MRCCCGWLVFALAWVSMATPMLCQSGDGDWGSGLGISSDIVANNDTRTLAIGDEPEGTRNNRDWMTSPEFLPPPPPPPPPVLHYANQADECSVRFSTNSAKARRLKAQEEELAYLRAIHQGNRAVMENLEQFVGAELDDLSYKDVIRENLIGVRDELKSCSEVVQKAEDDLEKQLEGDVSDALAGKHKIRDESLAFEDLLRAAADVADRLESSSQALHASFTKQLKDTVRARH